MLRRQMSGETLNGHRILVVEDEYEIAWDTARTLRVAGAEVMGPCPDEQAAWNEIEVQRPDAVVLDINLGHGPSFTLAEALTAQGIPFVFVTAYDFRVIPEKYAANVRLEKPLDLAHIVRALSKLITSRLLR